MRPSRPACASASRLGQGVLVAAAAGGAGLAYAALVERRWYRLRHETVPALRSAARRPLRVLHLSDLHLLPGQDDKVAFVRACGETAPDLVVATGDLVGHADSIDLAAEVLADVAHGRPAVAVLGSNDYYAPRPVNPASYLLQRRGAPKSARLDTERLVRGLEAGGWRMLDNARATVTTPAGVVDAAGLGDPHIHLDDPGSVDWSPAAEPVALRLGVVHAPYLHALDVFRRRAYDLVLAGHTHGGQLRLPGFGALVANCDLPLRQARGLSRHGADADRLWLHVSAGLGTSMYAPVRFACRPEATVLDLVSAAPVSD